MATGVITSITVRADGWSDDTVVEGFTTGAIYVHGLGTTNNQSTAKKVLSVTRLGYDATGSAVSNVVDTIWGVQTIRKVYPDEATLDETGGGNLSFRDCLSHRVYSSDIVVANVAAGFVVNAGGSSQSSLAASNLSVTNNSALNYPKCIGDWAIEQRRPVNGTVTIEIFAVQKFARNGKPVARVTATAVGADSGHSESGSATTMTLSTRGDLIPVYAIPLNLSVAVGFTRGELVTINFVVKPWVGDAGSILDSNADTEGITWGLGPLKWTIMSKMIARVSATGNDTTGVASETQATADAAPCLTVGGAMAKIAAANNSAYSLNRIDGGEVQCNAGTYQWNGDALGTSTNGYFTITHHSSTNRAGVVFDGFTSNRSQKAYQRFYDVTWARSSDAYVIFAGGTNVLIVESVNFNDAYGAWYSGDTNTNLEFIDCTYNNGNFSKGGNDGHCRLHRNCTYTATTDVQLVVGNASTVLGTKSHGAGIPFWQPHASKTSNYIIAFPMLWKQTEPAFLNVSVNLSNVAIVFPFVEHTGASGNVIGEFSDANLTNILLWHPTFAGQRFNHENDITAAYVNKTFVDFCIRFGSLTRGDHRADIRDTDAIMIGTWSLGYSVDCEGNHNEAIGYAGDQDFWGIRSNTGNAGTGFSAPVPAGYTSDNSKGGTDAGDGDYHPDVGSALLNRVPASSAVMPFDITGKAYRNDGTDAIGAFNSDAPVLVSVISAAPSGLTATATGRTIATLVWVDNSDNLTQDEEAYFLLERATDLSFTQNRVQTTVSADLETLGITGLAIGTVYYWRLRAVNVFGSSEWSNIAAVTTRPGYIRFYP